MTDINEIVNTLIDTIHPTADYKGATVRDLLRSIQELYILDNSARDKVISVLSDYLVKTRWTNKGNQASGQ